MLFGVTPEYAIRQYDFEREISGFRWIQRLHRSNGVFFVKSNFCV